MKKSRTAYAQSSLLGISLMLALSVASSTTHAHHAFSAEFDANKRLEIEGVVTKVRFVNPHSWIYVDVTDDKGEVTNWGLEFGTPSALAARGLTKEEIKAGTEVRIQGFHAKRGGPWGYAAQLTLPDGRTFKTGGAGDAPEPTAQASAATSSVAR